MRFTAVDGVSFDIRRGEILGVVGESGCGKTVSALALLRLIDQPGRSSASRLEWNGVDMLALSERQMCDIRGGQIAMIFQNPQGSLNPSRTIGAQISSVLKLHSKLGNGEAAEQTAKLLRSVHIPDPERVMRSYPHELSSGMCQRVMIAMAISARPQLLIADEPTASLDVTIQAQIMALMLQIRAELQMSILLVSHDLGVIARMCDRIAVMYLGRIVELGTAEQIYFSPKHPYTRALLKAVPIPDPRRRDVEILDGEMPSVMHIPTGCRFRTRCSEAISACKMHDPQLVCVSPGHSAACLLVAPETTVGIDTGSLTTQSVCAQD